MEFASFGLLQLATTNRGSRPEIRHNPGGRDQEVARRKIGREVKLPDTTNIGFAHRDNDVCFRQDPI